MVQHSEVRVQNVSLFRLIDKFDNIDLLEDDLTALNNIFTFVYPKR